LKLRRIAITEHFTMDSLPEILEVSRRYPDVAFIPGAELTVRTPLGSSVDLVCLGMPLEIPPELEAVFERYREWQRATGTALSEGMRALGLDFSEQRRLELLRTYRPQRVIDAQGVTHVQGSVVQKRYFREHGFAANDLEYKEVLQRAAKAVARPPFPDAGAVLPVVRRTGALVIAAHPSLYFKSDELKRLDELREAIGLDGVECAHDSNPPNLTPVYRQYCRERGLLSTAGSDCHADPADNPHGIAAHHEFARHLGEEGWLDELLERLPKR
jgi:predicted metal-dependent phosphoesterase TrpH